MKDYIEVGQNVLLRSHQAPRQAGSARVLQRIRTVPPESHTVASSPGLRTRGRVSVIGVISVFTITGQQRRQTGRTKDAADTAVLAFQEHGFIPISYRFFKKKRWNIFEGTSKNTANNRRSEGGRAGQLESTNQQPSSAVKCV